jgi:hypothetical protein
VDALRLHECDFVGFDLDHTLVRYRLDTLSQLIHDCVVRFLVEHKGYPPALEQLPCDGSFFAKGLLFDAASGNFLRLRASGEIFAASHGTRALPVADAQRQYSQAHLQAVVADMLLHGRKHKQYFYFSTFFDMPAALIAAHLVDLQDAAAQAGTGPVADFTGIVRDLLEAFDYNFDSSHFAADRGHYFPEMKRNTAR